MENNVTFNCSAYTSCNGRARHAATCHAGVEGVAAVGDMSGWTLGEWGGLLRGMREGPFTRVFGGPVAKVLDQSLYVGDMEQTIPLLAESTGLSFKTVQKAIEQLDALGLVKRSRKIGNTRTYRFDVGNDMHELIMWAEHFKPKTHH